MTARTVSQPEDRATSTPRLPLVSVIVTNYNYGSYIEQAVQSVLNQTYPCIECIVVDDCSTDNSSAVIETIVARHPEIISIRNEVNSGQSVSCVNGLRICRGHFVIFLDADDYLLELCVETHILTHLRLRAPVGFTSVRLLEVVDEQLVTTTCQGFADYVGRADAKERVLLAPPIAGQFGLTSRPDLESFVYFVHPAHCGLFPWSPTSANCFRKDALELVMFNSRLSTLRTSTDTYMLRGVSALCGSVLIDEPLAAYRIHTSNNFVHRASLHRVLTFSAEKYTPISYNAMTALIDYLLDQFAQLRQKMGFEGFLIEALRGLSSTWPPMQSPVTGLNYLTERLLLDYERLEPLLGRERYLELLWPHRSRKRARFLFRFIPFMAASIRAKHRRRPAVADAVGARPQRSTLAPTG